MIKNLETVEIPTPFGNFNMIAFGKDAADPQPHFAYVHQETNFEEPVLVRIHSECFTGDVMHSLRCDCGEQLNVSLSRISEQGGILIYLRQEGRGIGILNKMRAYKLQDEGLDTAQANIHLGFEADARTYEDAIFILKDLDVAKIILLTNNPEKLQAFENSSIEIVSREALQISARKENQDYLATKRTYFGHLLDK